MNFEKLFDVNEYTEKAMPLCTAICRMLDDKVFYSLSDEERESRQRYSDFRDDFVKSLSDEQREKFESYPVISCDELEIETHEHFNRGVKLGVVMMLEIFGEKPIDEDIQ